MIKNHYLLKSSSASARGNELLCYYRKTPLRFAFLYFWSLSPPSFCFSETKLFPLFRRWHRRHKSVAELNGRLLIWLKFVARINTCIYILYECVILYVLLQLHWYIYRGTNRFWPEYNFYTFFFFVLFWTPPTLRKTFQLQVDKSRPPIPPPKIFCRRLAAARAIDA